MKGYIILSVITLLVLNGCSENPQNINIDGQTDSISMSNNEDINDVGTKNIFSENNNHEYIDLGLPSGTLWATCNIGATKPTEIGDYFAWGETKPKKEYSWCNYKWCEGSGMTLTKYCTWHDDDTYGNTDDKNELEYDDDATITNWGDNWRTPLKTEIDELIDGCYWKWTNNFNGSGVSGTIGTSKSNGKCIFFPESGYYTEKGKIVNTDHSYLGSDTPYETEGGFSSYWSSESGECYPGDGYVLDFPLSYMEPHSDHCCSKSYGLCIRAVVNKNPKRIYKVPNKSNIGSKSQKKYKYAHWPNKRDWKELRNILFFNDLNKGIRKDHIKEITNFEYEDLELYKNHMEVHPEFVRFIYMFIDVYDYIDVPVDLKDECLCYMIQLLYDLCKEFNEKYHYGNAVGDFDCVDHMIFMQGYDFVNRIEKKNYYEYPYFKEFKDHVFNNMPFGNPKTKDILDNNDRVIVYGRVYDKDGCANLRSTDDPKSTIIGTIPSGEDVKVIFATQDDLEFAKMIKVKTKDNKTGFVHYSRLKLYLFITDESRKERLESYNISYIKKYEW